MDSAKAKLIMNDLAEVAKQIAKKHGMKDGNFRLTWDQHTIRFSCTMADEEATNGVDIDPRYIRNLSRNGEIFGLPSTPGAGFSIVGIKYTLAGLRGKKAIIKSEADGKLHTQDPFLVARAIKQTA